MDIRDFFKNRPATTVTNTYSVGSSDKIKAIAEYLKDVLPEVEKEFNTLQAKQLEKPNKIFPIKMEALAHIVAGADPLYEWYVTKAR